jgi:uroporphyrin-III C-methyltransferase
MGRKDARQIATQLIETSPNHTSTTPVHILEAVSTPRERHWSSNLDELANGKADQWLDSTSPALIMIGEALQEKMNAGFEDLQSLSPEINDSLQNTLILANSKRRA